jgi:hypothetical protein
MQHKISQPHLIRLRVICQIGVERRKPTCQPHGLTRFSRTVHETLEMGDHERLKSLTLILCCTAELPFSMPQFNMSHHLAFSVTGPIVINPIVTVPAYLCDPG